MSRTFPVHRFLGKYSKYLCKQAEFELKDLEGDDLKLTCQKGAKTVGGLDGFSPSEFSLLSDLTFLWLAQMLNLIEAGAPWPQHLLHAKAVFLSKDVSKLEDPTA